MLGALRYRDDEHIHRLPNERGLVLVDPNRCLEGLRNDELPLPPSPLPEERVAALFALLPRSHATQLRDRLQEPCYGDGHWQFDVKRYLAYAYLPRCLRKDSDR